MSGYMLLPRFEGYVWVHVVTRIGRVCLGTCCYQDLKGTISIVNAYYWGNSQCIDIYIYILKRIKLKITYEMYIYI